MSTDDILFFLTIEDFEESEYFYSDKWYQNISKINSIQFKNCFRMSEICMDSLYKYVSRWYKNKKSQLKLYLFVYFVGHGSVYREIRELFEIPKSSEFIYIKEMANILSELSKKYIKFSKEEEYDELLDGFARIENIKGPLLAIDGTKITIKRPSNNVFRYYDRSVSFSLNFICIVDYRKRFRGLTFGFSSTHDSFLYRSSNLKNLMDGISDENVYIVGDPAFINLQNIKSTYNTLNNPLSIFEEESLCKQRVVVENAFALFKNKWKRFASGIYNGSQQNSLKIILSTFFLHNFIINNN